MLFLVTRFPYPPRRGDQVRAYHHLVHLARRHEITLCVVGRRPSPDDLTAVTRLGISVDVIANEPAVAGLRMVQGAWDRRPIQALWSGSPRARSRVRALAAEADVVHAQLVRTGPLFEGLEVPVVLDMVDALSMNLGRRSDRDRGPRRWASAIEARRLGSYERSLAGRVAAVAVSTADDASAIGEPSVEVVPNGVDLVAFPFHSHPRPEPVVVFAGNLGYFPNVDAARTLARDIMPAIRNRMPAARLVLAGARPSRTVRHLQGTGVELITGPDDLAPVVGAAAVAVVPMRAGTGIQNKVLEAMAVGTPVVTTARVAAAVGAVHGEHLLIADGVDEFAAAAASLMTDPRGAAGIAASARRFVEERYRWEASAAAIERLWRSARGNEV